MPMNVSDKIKSILMNFIHTHATTQPLHRRSHCGSGIGALKSHYKNHGHA